MLPYILVLACLAIVKGQIPLAEKNMMKKDFASKEIKSNNCKLNCID